MEGATYFTYWFMFPISILIATVAMTFGIGGAAFFSPTFAILFPLLNVPTLSASEAFVYDIANDQREFFKPIFANETQYLPNDKFSDSQVKPNYAETLDVVSKSTRPSTQSLTIPPNKKSDNLLLKGLVVGAGIFLVYQILED